MKYLSSVIPLLLASCLSMAAEVEEPEWKLMGTLGDVELRVYSPSIEARTLLQNNGETSEGFKRLAGFIFGGNERDQEIAMTAPVQETLQDSQPTMAFTLPSKYSIDTLPAPDDDRVMIIDVPERTLAVVKFSGWATQYKVKKYSAKLLNTLKENGIEPTTSSVLNQYNPPWTLPFLRRNEISVEIPSLDSLNIELAKN